MQLGRYSLPSRLSKVKSHRFGVSLELIFIENVASIRLVQMWTKIGHSWRAARNWLRFFGLKDVKLNSESNRLEILKTLFLRSSQLNAIFLKNLFVNDVYATTLTLKRGVFEKSCFLVILI